MPCPLPTVTSFPTSFSWEGKHPHQILDPVDWLPLMPMSPCGIIKAFHSNATTTSL